MLFEHDCALYAIVHVQCICITMASNFDKLKGSVKGLDFPFDIIAISETWLKDNDTNSSCSIIDIGILLSNGPD